MIRLFKKDETNFDSNGLGVLDPAIKENVVEEKMNGIYNFDFAYLSKGKHASQLEGDMIIKAPTPDGDQLFRVYKVTKNIGFLEVNCYHIFYDLAGNFIEDINIVSQSGQAAITHFGTGLQYATRFKFVSNIVGTNSARMVRLNAVQALLDSSQDNSFLSRWGGEIKRDNFTIYMNDVRGNDKGFKIRHGKNLTGYEANIDYSTVVTRIMPYGYNGLMLPEKYVDSPLRDKYAFTRIKKIEYTNIKAIDPDATSNDEGAVPLEEAYKLLRQAAELEYSVNKVDIPTSNFKVTFKNLSDTKEYADFKALEKVDPWDYVTVIADNLDIKSRMISYKYDAITKSYKEVELGNYVPSFTDIGSKVDHATNIANQANDTANSAAESANGKNSNYYGPSEPSRPVDGDLWYKKNGDKTELWQYDGKSVPPGWKLVVDDATGEEVRQNVDAAQKEAEEAKKQANKAVDGANDAVAKAGFANDTATQAKSDAAAAGQQAKDALTSAGTAITDAKKALTDSGSAMVDSTQARKDSATAIKDAADSLTSAKDAINKVGNLTTSVTSQFTTVNNELESKVNQTDYDKLKGTVASQQTEIDQNASGIKLKADKSYADTINNSVVKNTSSVGLLNNQIALTVSKAELNNTLSSYATQTWTQSQIKSTADQINLSVTKVQTNLDNMELGSVNLIIRKDELVDKMIGQNGTIDQYAGSSVAKNIISVEPGKYLTMSRWGNAADNYFRYAFYDSAGNVITRSVDLADTPHTIQVPANSVTMRISYPTSAKVKLERGKKGTEWSLAPEDLASEVQFSQLQVTVNGIQGTVQNKADQSQVTQLANQISLKADTTALNELKGTVDKQGSAIDINTKNIALKANQSTVDTLTGRVSTAEGKITVQADQIAQTVSKTELTTKLNGYATQTWTQSQIKSTADQINLSVTKVQNNVDNMQIGAVNLIIRKDEHRDKMIDPDGTMQEYGYSAVMDKPIPAKGGEFLTLTRYGNAQPGQGDNNFRYAFFDKDGKLILRSFNDEMTHTMQIPANSVTMQISYPYTVPVKLERGKKSTEWSLAPEDLASEVEFSQLQVTVNGIQGTVQNKADKSQVTQLANQITSVVGDVSANSSQITQMKADINLRVKAGDVVNQINISPESILIAGQKVHITGQTSIDNAVIKDAMIADIKADKITAGTINGANVNVVNLNANNITTGTIKGANLSMNLNTGEVVFQHGRIHSASNNVDVNIDQGYLSVANGNTRVLLKNGGIQFVQPTIFDETTNPYLSISNGGSGLAFSGARIVGRDYVVMANNANSSNIFDSPLGGAESFAGISAGYDGTSWHPTKIGGADRGIILSAGKKLSSAISWVGGSASICIGSDGSQGWNSNRIELVGEYVHSLPTYVKTASGSANVIVARDGALVRSTSASKYKTDIIRTNATDYGDKLLELPTAIWTDIAETKRYRDDPTTQPEPTRNFGMIAEDLADAGLEMLVVRGADGELEGINYDRIGPALIPVIAKLKNEVEILKQKLEEKTA